ncbi:MAG: tryptophan 2,3-dioxygenase [Blastocatellia bacterium]|jgi:tryptophan 2,3-dioxygenase|nr:tryptophan 2,3-dioxygenase [Blastocatellia bacterium]
MTRYYEYLQLGKLLDSQSPNLNLGADEESAHDEMFFIIIHQVYELWFKAICHELDSVMETFEAGEKKIDVNGTLQPVGIEEKEIGILVSKLNRVIEIFKLLIAQIRAMETLTPLDFLDFRDRLIPASGYDSLQFHTIEIKLGLKLTSGRGLNTFDPERRDEKTKETKYGNDAFALKHIEQLKLADRAPSLFDYVKGWLERTPFVQRDGLGAWFAPAFKAIAKPEEESKKSLRDSIDLIQGIFDENTYREFLDEIKEELAFADRVGLSHDAFVAALFIHLYRDEPILQQPHRLLESLKEIDELFSIWRSWHSSMVMRMIGNKPGTAGSKFGYKYLAATRQYKFFPELDRVSTFMIPRRLLPKIPADVLQEMGRLLFRDRDQTESRQN